MDTQHTTTYAVGDKTLTVVDNHQYALLTWAAAALATGEPHNLISIDYHPDTNPPFWLSAYQKAMAIDPLREEALVEKFIARVMHTIEPENLETLKAQMPLMRNDEHIRTALALGYLKDYHMINCMEKHQYDKGHHYLVPEAHFGDLSDAMFTAAKFDSVSADAPYILDIDLDYFMRPSDLAYDAAQLRHFSKLVKGAKCITSARSVTYFDFLKREPFEIDACEKALVTLLEAILT